MPRNFVRSTRWSFLYTLSTNIFLVFRNFTTHFCIFDNIFILLNNTIQYLIKLPRLRANSLLEFITLMSHLSWRLKSPEDHLFVHTTIKKDIKVPHYRPFLGEPIDNHNVDSLTKVQWWGKRSWWAKFQPAYLYKGHYIVPDDDPSYNLDWLKRAIETRLNDKNCTKWMHLTLSGVPRAAMSVSRKLIYQLRCNCVCSLNEKSLIDIW